MFLHATELEFLGHIGDKNGVHVGDKNVEQVKYAIPQSHVRKLDRFSASHHIIEYSYQASIK